MKLITLKASVIMLAVLIPICSAHSRVSMAAAKRLPAPAEDGKALMAKGASLEEQRKYEAAADAYQSAADAFKRENNLSEQAKALGKSAAMLEKQANELTGGAKGAQPTPPPKKASPPKKTTEPAAGGRWKVGDKVDFWNSGVWYQGTISTGTGGYPGYLLVHWDKDRRPDGGEWVSLKNIRARQSTAKPDTSRGPRAGKYIILSYGDVTNPIRLGFFVLSGSSYQYQSVTGKTIGTGGYSYDAGTSAVRWTSGPLKQAGWTGGFRIEREGKTHVIQLNRATVGSNSTDS